MSLSSPTALITGGADRIGRALALHLAARGYRVGVHYHTRREEAEETVEMIRTSSRTATLLHADFRDAQAASALIKEAERALGPVSVLIHAASRFVREPFEQLSAEELSAHWQINAASPLLMTEHFAALAPQNAQAIFLTDALNGYSISGNYFAYALSRKAVEAAVPLLARRLAPRVRVNALSLGYVMQNHQDSMQTVEKIRLDLPLQTLTPITDITGAMDFLLTSESVTGEVIHLAGGRQLCETER